MRQIHHFIDGAAVASASGRAGEVFNPNTGEVQARVGLGTPDELELAVQSALRAQPAWAAVNPQRRARVMFEFKRLLEANMQGLGCALAHRHHHGQGHAALTRGAEGGAGDVAHHLI
ncbi:MAG: aldehyde dehydrogenase family protein, partial [Phenylobacterium sp.]